MSDALQILGALIVLVPFAWSQLGSLHLTAPVYLWSNLVGAVLLAAVALAERQLGFLLLEAAWALVAARGIAERARRRAPA